VYLPQSGMDAEISPSLLHVSQSGSDKLVYMELPLSAQSSHATVTHTTSRSIAS
jgi:hypothetical protein